MTTRIASEITKELTSIKMESNYVSAFEENGFVIIPDFFSIETINKLISLRKKIDTSFSEMKQFKNTHTLYRGLFEVDPILIFEIISNKTILSFLESVMGPFLQLDNLTIASYPSLAEKENQPNTLPWQRGAWAHVPKKYVYQSPGCVNLLIYFYGLDMSSSPLRVIPGSHKLDLTLTPEQRKMPHKNEVLLKVKKGDIIILHHCLVHSPAPNISQKSQDHLSVQYNHSWLKSSIKFTGLNAKRAISKAFNENDHKILRLFGIDLDIPERANSGFLTSDREMWREWSREDMRLYTGM